MELINKIFNNIKYKYPWEKFYDKEDRNIKVPNLSLYEYLKQSSIGNERAIAVNYFNKRMSFKKFLVEVDMCACALKSQGIREGDVVTICMPNTPEAIISFYSINKIGAIANMVHPLSAEEEIKQSLLTTKSVMLITIDLSYKKVKKIIDDTDIYKVVIVSASDSMPLLLKFGYMIKEGRKIEVPNKSEFNLFWEDFMFKGQNYNGKTLIKTTKDQPAVILHSGGTTGIPKNIVLTNGNLNALVEQAKIAFPKLGKGDSMLAILPLFHCFGLVVCIHAPLCLGASVTLIPRFDAKRFDKLLTKYKPSIIAGVPTLFEALLTNKHLDKVDLSHIKYILSGGDTLTEEKNEAVNKFLRKHNCFEKIIQGYGMTETSGPVAFGSHLGSVGIPLPSNIIKIVNPDTKKDVNPNEIGEICISGPTVMLGYLDNERETNEILEKDRKGNIWVHTGDLGYMDDNGILFFVSRLKRMLIVSGYNVYPSHIENVIMSHESVSNCGVIGIPHPYKVQVPKAFIVLKDGVKLNFKVKASIKEHCEKNLASYMIPKEFEYRESLPKTMIGKVNYRELEKE